MLYIICYILYVIYYILYIIYPQHRGAGWRLDSWTCVNRSEYHSVMFSLSGRIQYKSHFCDFFWSKRFSKIYTLRWTLASLLCASDDVDRAVYNISYIFVFFVPKLFSKIYTLRWTLASLRRAAEQRGHPAINRTFFFVFRVFLKSVLKYWFWSASKNRFFFLLRRLKSLKSLFFFDYKNALVSKKNTRKILEDIFTF